MSEADIGLTNEQRKVLEAIEQVGSLTVCACPGSGKTRTMVAAAIRAARRLTPLQGVGMLSFTQVAAQTYRERIAEQGYPELLRPPHFAGTFDQFILRYLVNPEGSPRAPNEHVRFRETWDSFDVRVRLDSDSSSARDVPLSAFYYGPAKTWHMDPARVKDYSLQAELARLPEALHSEACRRARERHRSLTERGFLTPVEARDTAMWRLGRNPEIARLLALRFRVFIVDEAQDCNDQGLRIVESLAEAGSTCVVVADPEQCIFGWRGASPQLLSTLGFPFRSISSNFRSTENICRAAASLRASAACDRAMRAAERDPGPIRIFSCQRGDYAKLGQAFAAHIMGVGGDLDDAVVLSYERGDARRAVGLTAASDEGTASQTGRLMRLLLTIRSAWDVDRRAVTSLDNLLRQLLLKRLGLDPEGLESQPDSLQRWVKIRARMLLFKLGSIEPKRDEWLPQLRLAFHEIEPPPGHCYERTAKQVLAKPQSIPAPKRIPAGVPLCHSTIHGAKGREFDSVLVVVNDKARAVQLLSDWRTRAVDSEARRILYVAVTRAKNHLCFGAPEQIAKEILELITRDGATAELHAV